MKMSSASSPPSAFSVLLLLLLCVEFFVAATQDNDILDLSTPTTGSVERHSWKCYDIPVQNGEILANKAYQMKVSLQESRRSSSLVLYAAVNRSPIKRYDYVDRHKGLKVVTLECLSAEDADIVTACAYGQTAGNFTIEAKLSVITPLALENHDTIPVTLEPDGWAYFQYNLSKVEHNQALFADTAKYPNKIVVLITSNKIPTSIWMRVDAKGLSNAKLYLPEPRVWYITLVNMKSSRYEGSLSVTVKYLATQLLLNKPRTALLTSSQDSYICYYDPDATQMNKLLKVEVSTVKKGRVEIMGSMRDISLESYQESNSGYGSVSAQFLVAQNTRYYFKVNCPDEATFTITASLQDYNIHQAINASVVSQPPTQNWVYSAFDVPMSINAAYEVIVSVNVTQGDIDLFLQYHDIPTPHSYDRLISSNEHHKSVSLSATSTEVDGKWCLGIAPRGKDSVSYTWQVLILPIGAISVKPGMQYDGKTTGLYFIDTGNAGDYSMLTISATSQEITITAEHNRIPLGWDSLRSCGEQSTSLSIVQPNGTWYFEIDSRFKAYIFEVQLENARTLGCNATTDSGITGQYKYYYYDIKNIFYLELRLDVLSSQGNAEMYVSHSGLPSRIVYDYSYLGEDQLKVLKIPPTTYRRVYIAVSITSSVSYSISMCKKADGVPSLISGVAIPGQIIHGWIYYSYDFTPTTNDLLVISVNFPTETLNTPQVYIQKDELPSEHTYVDFVKKMSLNMTMTLYVSNPQIARYYVGLLGSDKSPQRVTISSFTTTKDELATPITSLEAVSGSHKEPMWSVYSVYVANSTSRFRYVMKTLSGEPSLYVSYGQIPSLTKYKYRSKTWSSRSIAEMTPIVGFWYIGVYSSKHTSQYVISVEFNDQRSTIQMDNGVQVDATLSTTTWSDYSIEVTFGAMLAIQVSNNKNPLTLYISYGKLPDTKMFTRREEVSSGNIYIPNPQYGMYYISMKGNVGTNFTLSSFFGGNCNSLSCQCASMDCNSQTILATSGAKYDGLVNEGYWNHYILNVDSDSYYDLSLTFQTKLAPRDRILCFVRYGSAPTNTTYDYLTDSKHRSIQILDVLPGLVYFSIYGGTVSQNASYSIQANLTQYPECPNHCSGHGTCKGGICSCGSDWSGVDCSFLVTSLKVNETHELSGHLRNNTYNYLSIIGIPNNNSIALLLKAALKRPQLGGKIQIFANTNAIAPSSESYSYAASSTDNDSVSLTIEKMTKQQVVTVALYCAEGPVDYIISTSPTQPHSSEKDENWLAISLAVGVFVLLCLVGVGLYLSRRNATTRRFFGKLGSVEPESGLGNGDMEMTELPSTTKEEESSDVLSRLVINEESKDERQ